MFAIAKEDGPPLLWRFDEPESFESEAAKALLSEAVETKGILTAFNAPFELAISTYRMKPDLGLDPPDIRQWRCTQAMCRRAAAPESLAKAAEFFGLGDQKDPIGKALIGVFSDQTKVKTLMPPPGMKDPTTIEQRKDGTFTQGRKPANRKTLSPILEKPVPWEWLVKVDGNLMSVRDAWEAFCGYCKQDVRTERELHRKLKHFELKGDVLESFQFSLAMNHRGVPVNVDALRNAQKIVAELAAKLGRRSSGTTGLKHTQRAKVLAWLQERGYEADNLQAATVEEVLRDPPAGMKPLAVEMLRAYSLVQFAALAKIGSMEAMACDDGHVRGTMTWHGARTGRASGAGIQPQNFRRPTIDDTDLCYRMIREGWESRWFENLWESPLEALASSIRHFIQPHEGWAISCDFAAIEGRLAAWMTGDKRTLQMMLDGIDIYKDLGSKIFGVPADQITKDQRQAAKGTWLACIAEGQPVLTDSGYKPIEKITIDDYLWDGVEWVRHEGLIYKGERQVITHDGVTATADHRVFIEGRAGTVPLGVAASKLLRLKSAGTEGASVRGMGTAQPEGGISERLPLCKSEMPVREGDVPLFRQPPRRKINPMSTVLRKESPHPLASVVGTEAHGGKTTLYPPPVSGVEKLRRAWDRISIRFGYCCRRLGLAKLGGRRQDQRNRSHRQQRALRSGEFTLGHAFRTAVQQTRRHHRGIQPARMALLSESCDQVRQAGYGPCSDPPTSKKGGQRKAQRMASNCRVVRVYDILNAGPRRRFTVNGKLVHNCIYGAGGRTLRRAFKDVFRIDKTLDECKHYAEVYRETHPEIVDSWASLDGSAKLAIQAPGSSFTALDGRVTFKCGSVAGINYLTLRLPSGRRLYYPHPTVKWEWVPYTEDEMDEEPWKREKGGYRSERVSYHGRRQGYADWGRVTMFPAKWLENLIQAMGADFLDHGCLECERNGVDIRMVVHDEIFALKNGHDVESVTRMFTKRPEWALDFALEAEGEEVAYYRK